MLKFYRKAIRLFLVLALLSLILGFVLVGISDREVSFFPAQSSSITWYVSANSDGDNGGQSSVNLFEHSSHLNYSFRLSSVTPSPYAGISLSLGSEEPAVSYRDFSQLTKLSFWVTCSKYNILTFTLMSRDDKHSVDDHVPTYRPASTHFSCGPIASRVDINLKRLEVPSWWLTSNQLSLSDRSYYLEKVTNLNFGVSLQSTRDIKSNVNITELTLTGFDWRWLFVGVGSLIMLWLGFGVWYFRQYTKALVSMLSDKSKTDRSFFAQQELSLETRSDKNKNAVLAFMLAEYANPELSVDLAVSSLGINRVKLNAILKEEVGLTFSAYLNKLRLAEAARLLTENQGANVAEIAYSVGYKNASYFNKLFKDEYSCTPKTFKSLRREAQPRSD